ncbi:MAG: helix-turn-helix domain-containing protein, partial [Acidimicrobiia bacterium]|nr:helix-turn-helix domain-containing protein [Acidimicrobiia bacterium]
MAVSESELRRRAVDLYRQGWAAKAIGDELDRSREWVRKWVDRWKAEGDDGLVDRSRRPHHSPSLLDETVVAEIVAVRDRLENDPHANVGAVAVQAEMERKGIVDPPSLSSIKRVLGAAGRTRSYQPKQRSDVTKWALPSPLLPGIWQQSDWIHDRRVDCGTVFSSLQRA